MLDQYEYALKLEEGLKLLDELITIQKKKIFVHDGQTSYHSLNLIVLFITHKQLISPKNALDIVKEVYKDFTEPNMEFLNYVHGQMKISGDSEHKFKKLKDSALSVEK